MQLINIVLKAYHTTFYVCHVFNLDKTYHE